MDLRTCSFTHTHADTGSNARATHILGHLRRADKELSHEYQLKENLWDACLILWVPCFGVTAHATLMFGLILNLMLQGFFCATVGFILYDSNSTFTTKLIEDFSSWVHAADPATKVSSFQVIMFFTLQFFCCGHICECFVQGDPNMVNPEFLDVNISTHVDKSQRQPVLAKLRLLVGETHVGSQQTQF